MQGGLAGNVTVEDAVRTISAVLYFFSSFIPVKFLRDKDWNTSEWNIYSRLYVR